MHAHITTGLRSGVGKALGLAVLNVGLLPLAWYCGGWPGAVLCVLLQMVVLLAWRAWEPPRKTPDAGPLADLAHELRSPLTVLAGEIEAMQIGLRQPDAQTLDAMAGEVQRLSRLLQDLDRLLGHSRAPEVVPMQIIDVGTVIEQLLQRHRLVLQQAGLSVTLSRQPAPGVSGDALRLEQLFTNLLQNSLRYTDAPGQILIRVEATAGGVVQVTWEDSSPGVPGQALPRLTERFYRVPGHGIPHPHASGLGLAIARAIAEAHSATLQARHSQLGGLCWVLRIEAQEEVIHEASRIAG